MKKLRILQARKLPKPLCIKSIWLLFFCNSRNKSIKLFFQISKSYFSTTTNLRKLTYISLCKAQMTIQSIRSFHGQLWLESGLFFDSCMPGFIITVLFFFYPNHSKCVQIKVADNHCQLINMSFDCSIYCIYQNVAFDNQFPTQ